MTWAQSALEYLSKEFSDSWIARQTGIPRSTVGFVRRGERTLPAEYGAELKNYFQREAYSDLRDTGFSYHEARRYSSYAPETIRSVQDEMDFIVDRLSTGRAGYIQRQREALGEVFDWDDEKEGIMEDVRESLRQSRKAWFEIRDYPVGGIWAEYEE